MSQDEVESQLSAMFDGELPAAECELLSRRLDRDENLRARWARYALIGAAMRLEPVATARSDFAARVSRAVDRAEGRIAAARDAEARVARRHRFLWQGALAATLVGAVAGLSIILLRDVALNSMGEPALVAAQTGENAPGGSAAQLLARQREAVTVLGAEAVVRAVSAPPGPASAPTGASSSREPWSYVTPPDDGAGNSALRTELVDYIVAHSEYSMPLMRPDLLSALISGEDSSDAMSSSPAATDGSGDSAAGGITAGDATSISPAVGVGDNGTTAASVTGR